ncbi:hypothetical protein, partial [Streptomyces anulatus]|uniref:hypothetical protein n=1 Tax=Streptomyces anulatus TaxID=1892 RepID=UPI0036C975C9
MASEGLTSSGARSRRVWRRSRPVRPRRSDGVSRRTRERRRSRRVTRRARTARARSCSASRAARRRARSLL